MTVSNPDVLTMSKALFDSLPLLYQKVAKQGQDAGLVRIVDNARAKRDAR